MKALVLRIDAPLVSYGGVIVDQHGFVDTFPTTSMLTGLAANALGWEHGDFVKLQGLQERLTYAARWDLFPEPMIDYHTVDLGQPKMIGYADREKRGDPVGGWTTWGRPDHRGGGGAAKFGTHQRYRHYWMDGLMTLALGLEGSDMPDLATLHTAFREPARPLFLGRKTCLPARPLLDPRTPVAEGENLLQILRTVPIWDRSGRSKDYDPALMACWPAELGSGADGQIRRVTGERDWANQIPVGSYRRMEGRLGGSAHD
jgi:CRISPR system Cascade subunit CasD